MTWDRNPSGEAVAQGATRDAQDGSVWWRVLPHGTRPGFRVDHWTDRRRWWRTMSRDYATEADAMTGAEEHEQGRPSDPQPYAT